jgi:glyoxylase-like metal-dependent hydrolase (beta-lactamase superfamily II)
VKPRRIVEDVFVLSRRGVNAYLVLDKRELTLIDTGLPGSALSIVDAITRLGRRTDELKHIVVTHCHSDHAGSATALQRMVPASIYMHTDDAELASEGRCLRRVQPLGMRGRLLSPLLVAAPRQIEPVEVDHRLADGDELPLAGGMRVVHTPGHSEGHVALLAPAKGAVFAADAATNMLGVGLAPFNEDEHLARTSLGRLAEAARGLDVACLGHGPAVEAARLGV